MHKASVLLWTFILFVHLFFFALGWFLLFPFVYNEEIWFPYRASVNYWYFWINMYIHIRIQIKMLIPLMNKHFKEDKPGYLDPYIEKFKTWLKERTLSAGGKATTFVE